MNILLFASAFPAYLVARFLITHDPGERENDNALWSAVGFGALSIVLALILSVIASFVFRDLYLQAEQHALDGTFGLASFIDTFIFATIEEVVKFAPFAVFVYTQRYFNEITDGIIYFAIIGLSFGVIETVMYSLSGGIFTVAFRYGLGLFLHGALTAVVGYAFALHKFRKQSPWLAVAALLGVSVLHTIYNLGVTLSAINPIWSLISSGVAALATTGLFLLFYRACKEDYIDGRSRLLPRKYHEKIHRSAGSIAAKQASV